MEGAEEVLADGDVVGGGGEFEMDRLGGHAGTMVAQWGPPSPLKYVKSGQIRT